MVRKVHFSDTENSKLDEGRNKWVVSLELHTVDQQQIQHTHMNKNTHTHIKKKSLGQMTHALDPLKQLKHFSISVSNHKT